ADAGTAIFGLAARLGHGAAGGTARLTGAVPLGAGVDLAARYLLGVAGDGGPAATIDLRARAGAGPVRPVSPEPAVAPVGSVLPGVASVEGDRLVLTSPTAGRAGRIEVRELHGTLRRAFVTRATVLDEAAQVVLGFVDRTATGTPATPAQVRGAVDLRRGSDLSGAGWLRLAVDGGPFTDLRCAGPRPRASTDADVVAAIDPV